MRIATWNVNSVKQRLEHLLAFLKDAEPDVLCLQEIKCIDDAVPRAEIEATGYNLVTQGQKAFNGVAILSKSPLEDVRRGLPGDDADEQARYLEGVVSFEDGVMRVASIYLPNGNPVATKYDYKLAWMDRLHAHARELIRLEEPLALAGDYNVIPHAKDVPNPDAWVEDALYRPETRGKFQDLIHLGLTDAVRACSDQPGLYTFWDYQAGCWQRNQGLRIDHILMSPQAADRFTRASIHKKTRGLERPSDHVPVSADFRGHG